MATARDLFLARCLNHQAREAAARCPACGRFFCRECVSEHGERMLCAACIADATARKAAERTRSGALRTAVRALCGLALAWLCFWIVGLILTSRPDVFHPEEASGSADTTGEQGPADAGGQSPGEPGDTGEDR